MTWREFANEVPTEPRDVLLRYERDAMSHMLEPWVARGDHWIDGVYPDEPHEKDMHDWLVYRAKLGPNASKVMWRYIDPPGTESAETAAALRELDSILLEMVNTRVSESAHPLAPLVSRLTSEWTRLHQPSTDWEVTGDRDALKGMVGVLARWLKVDMP